MDSDQHSALRSFARDILEGGLEGQSFDGGDLQELGVKHGLLREVTVTEPCTWDEGCACAEYADFPTTCYRFTEIMHPPSPAEQPKDVTQEPEQLRSHQEPGISDSGGSEGVAIAAQTPEHPWFPMSSVVKVASEHCNAWRRLNPYHCDKGVTVPCPHCLDGVTDDILSLGGSVYEDGDPPLLRNSQAYLGDLERALRAACGWIACRNCARISPAHQVWSWECIRCRDAVRERGASVDA